MALYIYEVMLFKTQYIIMKRKKKLCFNITLVFIGYWWFVCLG